MNNKSYMHDIMIQVKEPDKEMMKEAIIEIKGSKRTMAELAADADISKPMLSRIATGNYTKAISSEVLEKLWKSAADTCRFDLKELYIINGYVTKDEAEKERQLKQSLKDFYEHANTLREMKSIITEQLFSKGYAIKSLRSSDLDGINLEESQLFFRGERDGEVVVSLPELDNLTLRFYFSSEVSNKDDYFENALKVSSISAPWFPIFLRDAWKPETMHDSAIYFVFVDERYYSLFIETMKAAKLNNRMSAILIDLAGKSVIKEHDFESAENFPKDTRELFGCRKLEESLNETFNFLVSQINVGNDDKMETSSPNLQEGKSSDARQLVKQERVRKNRTERRNGNGNTEGTIKDEK